MPNFYSFYKECMDLGSNPCSDNTVVPPVQGACPATNGWFWGLVIVAGVVVLVARSGQR